MAGSDMALIVGVFMFMSGVTVHGVLLVDEVMVGGVLLLSGLESEREIVGKVGVSVIVVVSVSVSCVL